MTPLERKCALAGMTYTKWQRLPDAEKDRLRDTSKLTPELRQYENCRGEVTYPDGNKRRFWVGRSTGWVPCHLEIHNTRSMGGGPVYFPEGTTVRLIRTGR